MRILGDVSSGRDNNYNLIRMIAASAVLVSHSWPLSLGPQAVEPLQVLTGFSLGTIAVMVFFAVSGFFITKSFDRRDSLLSFAAARVARIYPALLLVLLLTMLVLGVIFTSLPLANYFQHFETFAYVPRNLSLISLQYHLPGVFAANPTPYAINGSLWTLFYEVMCYFGVVIVGLCGWLRKDRFWIFLLFFLALQSISYFFPPSDIMLVHITRLSIPFVIGSAFYVYRAYVPLSGGLVAILGLLALLFHDTPAGRLFFLIWLCYGCFWFGHIAWIGRDAYNRIGDYSYGMYIYAYPVQQMVAAMSPGISPLQLGATSFPITLLLAALSWNFIERPALTKRHDVESYLCAFLARRRGIREGSEII